MTPLAFTVRPPLPAGMFIAITAATVISCGDRDIAATYDRALAQRICLLLNEYGLELGVQETEVSR
jgi:hypothetical protein